MFGILKAWALYADICVSRVLITWVDGNVLFNAPKSVYLNFHARVFFISNINRYKKLSKKT